VKHLLSLLVLLLALSACTGGNTPEMAAAQAAQGYYTLLADSQVEAFLDGKAGAESFPPAYRSQLRQVYQHYVNELNEEHGGIREVRISGNVGQRDSAARLTYAFLLLCFSDSVQEEITVPMIEQGEDWKMK